MRPTSMLTVLLAIFVIASSAGGAFAQISDALEMADSPASVDLTRDLGRPLMLSIVFTVIGVTLFAASIWVMVKFAPFPVIKEIEEDQNVALAIIMAAVILGLAMILCAAMLG